MLKDKRIFVTGSNGFLGKHVCRMLQADGAIVIPNKMDLTELGDNILPSDLDLIIHLAADVRGIALNRKVPYRFLRQNMLMGLEIIELSRIAKPGGIPIVAAGSVCAYPEDAPLPFNETDFWYGKPDHNNLGYGMAKRFLGGALECASIEFGLRYVHLISANLYGPGDYFGGPSGHVIPALISKVHYAKVNSEPSVTVWGTGKSTRDFLYVEDAARAYVAAAKYLLGGGESLECNIGSNSEIAIWQIMAKLTWIMKYHGSINFDISKPDGQPRRMIDTNKADHFLEWFSTTPIDSGLTKTVEWYLERVASEEGVV